VIVIFRDIFLVLIKKAVICRATARERVDKNISMEMDSWKPTRYGSLFHGYENERCSYGYRFLETNRSLWNQQKFPLIWMRRRQKPGEDRQEEKAVVSSELKREGSEWSQA
jgi:hypothetical protein